jgi:uncharacterized membrane protein
VGEAIGYGWNSYWKNIGSLLVITLVIVAVNIAFSVIAFVVGQDSLALQYLVNFIGWLVGTLLAFGLIRASLEVTRGQSPDVGDLFKTPGWGSYILASILFGISVVFGLIFCIVPGIIIAIGWGLYGFIICENPDTSPMDALSRSWEMTKGRRGDLFVLALALIGINLVGALLCGIGLIFTYGISAMAAAYVYRSLNGQSVTLYN